METKLVANLSDAIRAAGLQDGMTISFHHHMRNGDFTLNLVMEEISKLGIRDLTVNASSLFDIHTPIIGHIQSGVVRKLLTDYVSGGIGRYLSSGVMSCPVEFRSHGTRATDIASGATPIDVAFVAAPAADCRGNCTGKLGKSACGSLGYAIPDAMHAKRLSSSPIRFCPIPCPIGPSRKTMWTMWCRWTPSATPRASSPAPPASPGIRWVWSWPTPPPR